MARDFLAFTAILLCGVMALSYFIQSARAERSFEHKMILQGLGIGSGILLVLLLLVLK